MSDPKSGAPKDAAPNGNDKRAPREKTSGRVSFDARGNAVWEWQTATGVYGRDVDTKRLKKLEAKDLKLLDTQRVQPAKPGAPDSGTRSGAERFRKEERKEAGFDPYNSSVPPKVRINTPAKAKPADPASGAIGRAADVKQVSEWFGLTKPNIKKD